MTKDQITELVVDIAKRARTASLELATLPTETKNNFLLDLAKQLLSQTEAILEANALDLEAAQSLDLSAPMTERLSLTARAYRCHGRRRAPSRRLARPRWHRDRAPCSPKGLRPTKDPACPWA
jgi:hypothetical protein